MSLRNIHSITTFQATSMAQYSVLSTGDMVKGKKDVVPTFRSSYSKKIVNVNKQTGTWEEKKQGRLPGKVAFKLRSAFWRASLIQSKRKNDPGKQNFKQTQRPEGWEELDKFIEKTEKSQWSRTEARKAFLSNFTLQQKVMDRIQRVPHLDVKKIHNFIFTNL